MLFLIMHFISSEGDSTVFNITNMFLSYVWNWKVFQFKVMLQYFLFLMVVVMSIAVVMSIDSMHFLPFHSAEETRSVTPKISLQISGV